MGVVSIGRFFRRYSLVILFPTITAGLIYGDYTHTQQWKKLKTAQQ